MTGRHYALLRQLSPVVSERLPALGEEERERICHRYVVVSVRNLRLNPYRTWALQLVVHLRDLEKHTRNGHEVTCWLLHHVPCEIESHHQRIDLHCSAK